MSSCEKNNEQKKRESEKASASCNAGTKLMSYEIAIYPVDVRKNAIFIKQHAGINSSPTITLLFVISQDAEWDSYKIEIILNGTFTG